MRNYFLIGFFVISCKLFANVLPSRLVSADWLINKNNEGGDYLLIDSRSEKKYAKSHIPGAINLPVKKTFEHNKRANFIAPLSEIRRLFSQAGIDFNREIIVYDDGELVDAARLIWILEMYGIKQVAMLDGGYKSWLVKGYLHSTKPVIAKPSIFVPSIQNERFASRLATRLAIENKNIQLVDARSKKEYLGFESKTARKGHIPTAINVPWDDNYTKQANGVIKLKSRKELEKVYAALDKNKKVIAYCNKGKQSALTHFILIELGYKPAAYDGSWFDWSSDDSLPITTSNETTLAP